MKKRLESCTSSRPRAFGYVRVSTNGQAEHKISIAQQELDLKAWCDRNDWDLVRIFVDTGLSGSNAERPQFNLMIDLATSDEHPVDYIVAADMSRFARDVEFIILTERRLHRAGVTCRYLEKC